MYYKASLITWNNNHSDWETVWVKASNLEEAMEKLESLYTLTEECEDNLCYRNGTEIRLEMYSTQEISDMKRSTSNGFAPEVCPEYTKNGVIYVHRKKSLSVSDREQYWVI